ncbi:heme anaerobic degradation radical SAM methyltransferase ChuW/HutW [Rhodobacteraceae bacterium LMO-12]|nr:heme anaerobic degradation radical SAM methyltransferase ChuW/HutW [Rhodobacteraceae bacterium LMO-JJ12]
MGEARIAPRRPDMSPAADRPPLENFYAKVTSNPLSDAFPGKRAVHPFAGMAPVPETEVGGLWSQIHQTPRSNRAVAYVHVPFCENHCLFCGFYQNAWRKDSGGPFVDAVIAQLQAFARQPAIEGPPLQAIYLGGGTPTALAAPDLARLITALRRYLPLTPDCEITLEGRVLSFGQEKARAAFDAGVTRISLGIQSFSERIRKPLGRRANRQEIIRTLEHLVALDRGAIVVDLIYGLPHQRVEDLADDVRLCAQLGLDGLDLYSLNLIAGTPLMTAVEKGKLQPSSQVELGAFFSSGEEAAEQEGWRAISTTHWQGSLRERNVYNVAVKTGADCLAFGAGAGGFLGQHNYRITSNLADFHARAGSSDCLTPGMMRQSPAAPVFNAIKSGMERGRLDSLAVDRAVAATAGDGAVSFSEFAGPLLAQWHRAGLFVSEHRYHNLTRAGRFWQVAMTGRLLGWLGQHPNLGD